MTPERFARRMEEIAAGIENAASDTVRRAALAVDRDLVLSTPVDTGRARSNWLVGVNAPVRAEREPTGTAEAIEAARATIAAAPDRAEIWISNNLPYIGRLNQGHSAQAPAGFVEIAILNGVRVVRQARLVE